jgi:hypothetical protein
LVKVNTKLTGLNFELLSFLRKERKPFFFLVSPAVGMYQDAGSEDEAVDMVLPLCRSGMEREALADDVAAEQSNTQVNSS